MGAGAVSETGESTASINRRSDDEAWPVVLSALQDGATLFVHRKIDRAAVDGLEWRDPRSGRTITRSRALRLEREGVLYAIGVDRYALRPGWPNQ